MGIKEIHFLHHPYFVLLLFYLLNEIKDKNLQFWTNFLEFLPPLKTTVTESSNKLTLQRTNIISNTKKNFNIF